MSAINFDRSSLKQVALQIYVERLKDELERTHFGEVIAITPDSGMYVVGRDFAEVDAARQTQLANQLVFVFRIGGGGALRIGGVQHPLLAKR